jgi:hypothetical protein
MPTYACVDDEAAGGSTLIQASSLPLGRTLTSTAALLQDIHTPVNEEGCLCIVDDKAFCAFDSVAGKLRGKTHCMTMFVRLHPLLMKYGPLRYT